MMLGHTLAFCVFSAAIVAAQLQKFALDRDSIDVTGLSSPSPATLPETTSEALISVTTIQTALLTLNISAGQLRIATNFSIASCLNRTASTTCLPTTAAVVLLPNPTPTPDIGTSRSEDEKTLIDDEPGGTGTPFDIVGPETLSKWPQWFTAATFTLIFYDILTLGIFLWLWVFGYLWWFRRGGGRRGHGRGWRRGAVSEGHFEMTRMDIGRDEVGRYERTSEWVRTGRGYGGARSESWERVRRTREDELEREMMRLGML